MWLKCSLLGRGKWWPSIIVFYLCPIKKDRLCIATSAHYTEMKLLQDTMTVDVIRSNNIYTIDQKADDTILTVQSTLCPDAKIEPLESTTISRCIPRWVLSLIQSTKWWEEQIIRRYVTADSSHGRLDQPLSFPLNGNLDHVIQNCVLTV